jgi:uncharacterized protein (TIGR00304 family)
LESRDTLVSMDLLIQLFYALIAASVLLILTGFILIALSALRRGSEGKAEAGGVLMIGPLPIIFGSNAEAAKKVSILAIVLMFLFFFFIIMLRVLEVLSTR